MERRLPTTQNLHFWITRHGWTQWEPTLGMEFGRAVGMLLLPAPRGEGAAPSADWSSSLCRESFLPLGSCHFAVYLLPLADPPKMLRRPLSYPLLCAPSPAYLSLRVHQTRVDVVPGAPAALVLPDQHRGRAVCHPSLSGPDLGRQAHLALAQLSHPGQPEPTQSLALGALGEGGG